MTVRTKVAIFSMIADIVGVVLIIFVLPLAWSTSIVLAAVWLLAVNGLARLYARRLTGG